MFSFPKDEKNQKLILGLVILSFTILIYLPSFRIPFVSDEIAFISRNQIHSLKGILHLFNFQTYDSPYYRPVPDLISGIFTWLFGYNPVSYRTFNVLLHGLNGIVLFLLISAIFREHPKGKLIAFFSAIFFCAFPLHDYAVIWDTDLFDRVMAFFYLLGLLSFIKNKFRPGFSSLIFFIISLLSKEMAFSFPLIIWLTSYFLDEPRFNFKRSIKNFLPYVFIAFLLIVLRILLFNNNLFNTHGVHSHAGVIDVIRDYIYFIGMLVIPFFLREIQNFVTIHKILFFTGGFFIACGMIYLLFKYRKKDYLLFYLILFIIITIAPASRLLMRWYLYLPSVGFTTAPAYFIFSINFKKIKSALIILVFFMIIYSGGIIGKEIRWVNITHKAIYSLNNFISQYRREILRNKEVTFLTIPAKVNDIPVFQLRFDKLFNFYFKDQERIDVKIYSKSYLSNFNDTVLIKEKNGYIKLSQKNDNYFILFNDEKNVKFEALNFKNGKLTSLLFNKEEEKNKILFTFSNGKFYKL